MNRSRMSEIMKTGLIARASVPLDAGNRTQTAESLCHHCIVQRRAVLLAEQQILAVSRMPSVMLRDECHQHFAQARADRDDARLEELRLLDVEQRTVKIDVLGSH